MSTDTVVADKPDYVEETPRVDVAEDMQKVMTEALHRFTQGTINNAENERVRIKWLRAYVNAATEYRQLLKDIEANEQEQRIERLEQQLEELTT